MVSAIDQATCKLGEKNDVQAESIITGSSLQQQQLHMRSEFANLKLAKYESMRALIDYLRHHNPDCWNTIIAYDYTLRTICGILTWTPDQIINEAKTMAEEELMKLFLSVDRQWIDDLCSPKTRIQRWAILKTFLYSNGIYKAKPLMPNIQGGTKFQDYALSREDCRKVLESCENTTDKLVVSLLIESLQRIGTISSLTWGDVLEHLENSETTFLIWIDAKRTKRSISHWMPVGNLSVYYMRKRREELTLKGIDIQEDMPLITPMKFLRAMKPHSLATHVYNIMMEAGIKGKRTQLGSGIRYEKRVHSFRKFGVLEMQRAKVNEEIIRFLMGQARDTYSNWIDKYDELLEAYREAMPRLEQKDTFQEVIDFAKSRGFSLDPKALERISIIGKLCHRIECGDIRVDQGHSGGGQTAGAQEGITKSLQGERKGFIPHVEDFQNPSFPLFFEDSLQAPWGCRG